MDWIICILCSIPLWGSLLLYFLTDLFQMRRYESFIHIDNFVFVKTKQGELIRKGLTGRNWLAIFFLGVLQLVFLGIIFQSLLSDPVAWSAFLIVGLLVVFVGWLMTYFLRLLRVSPIYFDPELNEVRFKDDTGTAHQIPFADIEQVVVKHAGPRAEDAEKAPRSTYTVSLTLKNSEKSLMLARITGRSVKKNTQQKDILVGMIASTLKLEDNLGQLPSTDHASLDVSALNANQNLIAENLRQIQEEGGAGNFVIFIADPRANYYIQLAGQKGDPTLHAEAADNQVITDGYQLTAPQQAQIETLGWEPATMNYIREWQANSDASRLEIAALILQTFTEGYGIPPDTHLEIKLNLE